MKAIAIVDLPDDAFEDDTRWIIDDEGSVRYLGDIGWMRYKDINEIELRPLPQFKEEAIPYQVNEDVIDAYQDPYTTGWNDCLKEITGDTEQCGVLYVMWLI